MERAVILFDDDCGFCRWSLSKILARDRHGRLRPVALQSPEADDLLMGMDPEEKMASWHLVAPDGHTYSGGEAVSHLARLLSAGAPITLLVRAFPHTTDRAYRWVAGHRDRLGRAIGERACAGGPRRAGVGVRPVGDRPVVRSSGIRPANDRETSRNDEKGRATNAEVRS